MWKISKSFEFNYGHRIATQELNSKFSLDQQCKCRYLHGHTATIEVTLQSNKLKDGFVTDFYHLNWLKKWIDENIDHKFIMDKNDPMTYPMLRMRGGKTNKYLFDKDGKVEYSAKLIRDKEETGYVFDTKFGAVVKEYYDSFFFVDFPPTSECLSKWIYDFVEKKMKPLQVEVTSVTWYESPKSKSVYSKK